MFYGGVQRRRVPAAEGFQEGSRRVRALPETDATGGGLKRRALSRRDRIFARAEAQGRRHRDRGRDLGQTAYAGGGVQTYPRIWSRGITGAKAQARRHRDRGRDLGQTAYAGGRLQTYRRIRSRVITAASRRAT